jgi:hypothetical protein
MAGAKTQLAVMVLAYVEIYVGQNKSMSVRN